MTLLSFRNYWVATIAVWKASLQDKAFTFKLLLVPILFLIYSFVTQHLGNYIEMRKGVQLEDKLLSLFPSIDFSASIFIILYTSLLTFIITHLHEPKTILRIIEMHFLVAVVRQMCILMVALEPPANIIVLRDLFLENTVYPHNSPLTKDLFFSGHVASLWIYFLCSRKTYLKAYLLVATFIMSFMLLSMRVHYTYDVYGAVFFTTIIYFIPSWTRAYLSKMQADKAEGYRKPTLIRLRKWAAAGRFRDAD